MSSTGWTTVGGQTKRRGKGKAPRVGRAIQQAHAANLADKLAQVQRDNDGFRSLPVVAQEEAHRHIADVVLSRVEELREGAWSDSLANALATHLPLEGAICDVVCLGIGSFGTSRIAQYQLAALIFSVQRLGLKGKCTIFDPVLTDAEKGAATLLHFGTPGDNTEGKWRMRWGEVRSADAYENEHATGALSERFGVDDSSSNVTYTTTSTATTTTATTTATTPTTTTTTTTTTSAGDARDASEVVWTVFYMPHCGRALINNVLWANWGPELARLLLVGNSLASIATATFAPTTAYPALAAALAHAVETVPAGLDRYAHARPLVTH
jgi:hypothetical protein